MVYWLYEYDWPAADREFLKAIKLKPNYARAPHWFGLFLAEMGRFDEAIAMEERAVELEPQSIPVNADLARVLFYSRRYDQSLGQYRKTIELSPKFEAFYLELLELFDARGGFPDEWIDLLEKTNYFDNPSLKKALETGSFRDFYLKTIGLYHSGEITNWNKRYTIAGYYTRLNDKERAFEFLEKAFAERDHRMAQIKVHPLLDNLRSEPRFTVLLQKMNFEN